MTIPIPPADPTAIVGHSYSGLFVRADHEAVLARLTEHRFTGWLGPQQGGWVLAVAEEPAGPVAGSGLSLLSLAATVAGDLLTITVAVRVEKDVVLRLDGWDGTGGTPSELGSYVSDPSVDAPDDDEVFPEPDGAHHAETYARACGQPGAAEELYEVLAEEIDTESVLESERLDTVLRLLDLPRWLISAQSLPRDLPAGPRKAELVRLGAGRAGAGGLVLGAVTGALRKRRRPR